MIHILTTGGTIEGWNYIDDTGITSSNIGIRDSLDKANIDLNILLKVFSKKIVAP